MAEERLKRNLDAAFDPGPDFPNHLWLSRTMAQLGAESPPLRRGGRFGRPAWLLPLVAVLVVVTIITTIFVAGQLLHSSQTVPSRAGKTSIREYPFPVGSKYALGPITVAPGGDLFIGAGAAILNMTPSGRFTEYTIPTTDNLPQAPYQTGITMGPDGSVWFTEYPFVANAAIEGRVFKMTPAGAFTEYLIPLDSNSDRHAADFGPEGITAGPDGNLWFAEPQEGTVAKMTTAGVLTEYAAPVGAFTIPGTNNPGEPEITAGPDGNLWFVEPTKGMVARMTTSGEFHEFSLPRAGYEPTGIAAGPDGNLWVTEVAGGEPWGGEVARLTSSGKFTEYPVPNAGYVWTITAGQDGNLWFIDQGNIARMTTTGVVTEYPMPASDGSPVLITTSSSGTTFTVRFLTLEGGMIGVLTPASDP